MISRSSWNQAANLQTVLYVGARLPFCKLVILEQDMSFKKDSIFEFFVFFKRFLQSLAKGWV
jgi:hypothetical protein